jgi:DNA-directed RNA polymerase beta' subunit
MLLNTGKKQGTDLLNTSKKNDARGLYSVRVKNSARCPIVPSTTLAVDEIGIPLHLAYEMCREGFIKHLIKVLNFTQEEAEKSTKEEYENPELMRLFKEYAENQVVLSI